MQIIIGKGGQGGLGATLQKGYYVGNIAYSGTATNGTDTIINIHGKEYVAGGGYAGSGSGNGGYSGNGGTGIFSGRDGTVGGSTINTAGGAWGSAGGGGNKGYGGGGHGGSSSHTYGVCYATKGDNGNNGVVIIEYYKP